MSPPVHHAGIPSGLAVKNLSALQEPWVWSLGWEDPLEKEMATHSNILAWRIPWTEEPGRLQSMGLQRVGYNWSNCACMHIHHGRSLHMGSNSISCTSSQAHGQFTPDNTWKRFKIHLLALLPATNQALLSQPHQTLPLIALSSLSGMSSQVCFCLLLFSKAVYLLGWLQGMRWFNCHAAIPSHHIQDTCTHLPVPQMKDKWCWWLCSQSGSRFTPSLFMSLFDLFFCLLVLAEAAFLD